MPRAMICRVRHDWVSSFSYFRVIYIGSLLMSSKLQAKPVDRPCMHSHGEPVTHVLEVDCYFLSSLDIRFPLQLQRECFPSFAL